eukprot:TRINITY_DN20471_c0_g1_i1.p1 TRINITY_DN20471_c0_g1~~TRINITY_DN20471_c0_g1_i1.p1  ORF type:complete len:163 (-),score=16.96 TRINITY_DN20471_c0_g1_i1:92-580(-)
MSSTSGNVLRRSTSGISPVRQRILQLKAQQSELKKTEKEEIDLPGSSKCDDICEVKVETPISPPLQNKIVGSPLSPPLQNKLVESIITESPEAECFRHAVVDIPSLIDLLRLIGKCPFCSETLDYLNVDQSASGVAHMNITCRKPGCGFVKLWRSSPTTNMN